MFLSPWDQCRWLENILEWLRRRWHATWTVLTSSVEAKNLDLASNLQERSRRTKLVPTHFDSAHIAYTLNYENLGMGLLNLACPLQHCYYMRCISR